MENGHGRGSQGEGEDQLPDEEQTIGGRYEEQAI
jgi:hypothetical protein